ncbi:MAG: beta-ketoacyl-ACP synthase III [Verrucomicrobiia bacterium]
MNTASSLPTASITGFGSYAPKKVLTNFDLEKMVDTTNAWILERTGIQERHIAEPDECTSDMGAIAAQRAMEKANIKPEEIDLIIVATATPDMPFPSTACWIQKKIGATRAAAFDITAACSGFLYCLAIAQQFIQTQAYRTILIVGSEKLSSITNWKDRNTCVLFGDAAGAVVLQDRPGFANILINQLWSDGRQSEILKLPAGGTACPTTVETLEQGLNYMQMSGREVFKIAINTMAEAIKTTLTKANLNLSDISYVIPHQANIRIIQAIAEKLNLPIEKFHINIQYYGNTSSASIPLALDQILPMKKFKKDDKMLLIAFGGGLTWACTILSI